MVLIMHARVTTPIVHMEYVSSKHPVSMYATIKVHGYVSNNASKAIIWNIHW